MPVSPIRPMVVDRLVKVLARALLGLVVLATSAACEKQSPPPSVMVNAPALPVPPSAPTAPAVLTLGGPPARWRVDVVVADAGARARVPTLGPMLGAIVAEVDRQFDMERTDAELRPFNRSATRSPVPVGRPTLDVIAECLELGRRTDGAFDVTAAPLQALWADPTTQPSTAQIAQVRARTGLARVRAEGGMLKKDVVDLMIDARVVADAVIARGMVSALAEREVRGRFRVQVGDVLIADDTGLDGPWRGLDEAPLSTTTGRVVLTRSRARPDAPTVDPRSGALVSHDVVGCDVVGRDGDPVALQALAEACLVAGDAETTRLRPRFGDVDVAFVRRSGR